jgi:hypothetical protein
MDWTQDSAALRGQLQTAARQPQTYSADFWDIPTGKENQIHCIQRQPHHNVTQKTDTTHSTWRDIGRITEIQQTNKQTKTNSVASVRERTIPTKRPLLSTKLVLTFMDRRCRVVSATDPYGLILGLLDRSRYFFFQVAPHLYSRG